MTQQEIALKVLRSIHAIFVTSILLYAFMAEKVMQRAASAPSPTFVTSMTILAIAMTLIAATVRRRIVTPAIERLRVESEDPRALNRWRSGSLISFVLVECVALYGFVLRVLGASRPQTLPFYLVAILLMLIWTPRLDSAPSAPR
jgi:F0F1-type ATP synthase membrane subunit c/vacuolar-type H+-ATPase subunit K